MNTNKLTTTGFSNPDSEALYGQEWPDESELQRQYEDGHQCGGCSFFAPFNDDYGLCSNAASRHRSETVSEHFTCPRYVREGWGPHSFTDSTELHCKCQGEPIHETLGTVITLLDRADLDEELRSHLRALRRYVEKSSP